MLKKMMSVLPACAAVFLLLAGCTKSGKTNGKAASGMVDRKTEGKVINFCVYQDWTKEFVNDYYPQVESISPDKEYTYLKDGTKIRWIVFNSEEYQEKLDALLKKQNSSDPDERVDIMDLEGDYFKKYLEAGVCVPLSDLGITENDLSQQYNYTKEAAEKNGKVCAISVEVAPGLFAYRRSIAKDVLGTDDPAQVQAALNNWDKFDSVAAKAKAKGYFMLSGYDDAYRVFSDNVGTACVKGNKIVIDPQIKRWIAQTKTYTDKGYNNKANLWSNESFKGAAKNGKVFGYFGPAWFIDFCLAPATLDDPSAPKKLGNGSYGDWAFCKGPQGFSWGGTWICAAAGTDNVDIIRDIMYTMTCDKITMTKIAKEASLRKQRRCYARRS